MQCGLEGGEPRDQGVLIEMQDRGSEDLEEARKAVKTLDEGSMFLNP